MKAYMLLATGFEETEAIAPLDVLRRAGIDVLTVGIGSDEIESSHGVTIKADLDVDDVMIEDADLLILPGGMPGTVNLESSDRVKNAVMSVAARGAYVCAICAAPRILGTLGLLDGKRAVCYPGNEKYLTGAILSDKTCVRDGNIITAKGAGASLEFGYAIVEAVCGEERADSLKKAMIYS